jgi:hypothetical protein
MYMYSEKWKVHSDETCHISLSLSSCLEKRKRNRKQQYEILLRNHGWCCSVVPAVDGGRRSRLPVVVSLVGSGRK